MRAVHLLVTARRTEPFIQSLCVADMWIWHIDMEVYFITPSDCQAPCRLGVDWTDDVQASVCSFSWQTAACLTRSETSRTHKTTYKRKTKIVPWRQKNVFPDVFGWRKTFVPCGWMPKNYFNQENKNTFLFVVPVGWIRRQALCSVKILVTLSFLRGSGVHTHLHYGLPNVNI